MSGHDEPLRTLADDLRRRDDDQLAALLAHRPDLLHPVPPDLAALVSRAGTSLSTSRAIDRLDAWLLQMVEVLAALPDPTTETAVVAAVPGVDGDTVMRALDDLRERALLWGDPGQLHLVRAVRDAAGTHPCGLSAAGLTTLDTDAIARLVGSAPDEARVVLDQLVWGPPLGSVPAADRPVTPRTARTPIEWLLAHGLIVPLDSRTVVLPREVALVLRQGAFLRSPAPHSPAFEAARSVSASQVDGSAGQVGLTAVRWVEDLLEHWAVTPPSQLRSGGLGVRDLTAAARLLDVDEATAALVVEVAHGAGLLASDEEEQPVWLPTPGYDLWLTADTADRWATLANAWLIMSRAPALVGSHAEGRVNALTAEVDRPDAPEVRQRVLRILAGLPKGQAAAETYVHDALAWERPSRAGRVRDLLVDSTLREAALWGVTAHGALSSPGRALLEVGGASAPGAVASAMRPLLPEPLDHVLLQADLTAVAPGPLESSLARELALMADVESTGAATVYRFSADSLRRAFDAGRVASDVLTFLQTLSRTPVPQPLTYLVDDVARRHGVVRVGAAGCYVRCDDDAALASILADKRAVPLRPMRLAPGVLVLQVPVDEALPALRALGLAPAAETPDGTVVIRRPDSRRAPRAPRSIPRSPSLTSPDPLLLTAAVKALRAGDRVASAPRGGVAGPERLGRIPVSAPADTIAALRHAIDEQSSLWIGYADTDGRATERIIDPVEISRGFLTAYDHRYEEVRSFALARITGVAPTG